MSNSGGSGGSSGTVFAQDTFANRGNHLAPGALFYATDTGEFLICNAAGTVYQSIASTATLGPHVGQLSLSGNGFSMDNNASALGISCSNGGIGTSSLGKGLFVKEGANAKQGTATLAAGTVTVATTAVTANSRIFITAQEAGALTGVPRVSARVAGSSFTITSTVGTDTATFAWEIFEPA